MLPKTIYRLDYLRLIARLREQRLARGLTQADVALAVGWPQQRVSAVESGSRRLDIIEFFRLASALGLSPRAAVRLLGL